MTRKLSKAEHERLANQRLRGGLEQALVNLQNLQIAIGGFIDHATRSLKVWPKKQIERAVWRTTKPKRKTVRKKARRRT